ncbi:hypothetical protein AXG93_4118s1030 [Marchantia polymorpha subsp. ruderalis]|uniref:Uncharacterized protein n=1 Tax=Marchantia polymorpha subsp. ruderalis TaxID=1480154 RepID=A0A176W0S4_MARPO|nr:hypothetical protein AXG93_4118s1030 [Marchantia polymorpha subsp. ruderalis]
MRGGEGRAGQGLCRTGGKEQAVPVDFKRRYRTDSHAFRVLCFLWNADGDGCRREMGTGVASWLQVLGEFPCEL